jgi:TorA maturation chaperone TorD
MDYELMNNPQDVLNRGNCFKLLAACFYQPDKEMFLEEHLGDNLVLLLQSLAPAAAASAEAMRVSLGETAQEQLDLDYAALFVGPFELIAAPYGSIYLEKIRRVMGDSTLDAHRFYQDAGLSMEMKEPADHIAIELEFMYYLCSREATALSEGMEDEASRLKTVQLEFFRKMMGWIPQFCERIRAGAGTAYYRAVAGCLAHFYASCQQVYQGAGLD